MVSAYGVITITNLEAVAGVDYSALYSGYSDTVLEAQISQAERLVLSYIGNLSLTTNPLVVYAVGEVAKRMMYNMMIHDAIAGYSEKKPFLPVFDELLQETLNDLRALYGDKRKIWIQKVQSW